MLRIDLLLMIYDHVYWQEIESQLRITITDCGEVDKGGWWLLELDEIVSSD